MKAPWAAAHLFIVINREFFMVGCIFPAQTVLDNENETIFQIWWANKTTANHLSSNQYVSRQLRKWAYLTGAPPEQDGLSPITTACSRIETRSKRTLAVSVEQTFLSAPCIERKFSGSMVIEISFECLCAAVKSVSVACDVEVGILSEHNAFYEIRGPK